MYKHVVVLQKLKQMFEPFLRYKEDHTEERNVTEVEEDSANNLRHLS